MTSARPIHRPAPTAGELRETFARNELFAGMGWRTSPSAWALTEAQVVFLEQLGEAIVSFNHAVNHLYLKSAAGASLLRNRERREPWVAELYDRGKPEWLVRHARHPRIRRHVPAVLRPDLLPTEDGFALTELDSVPGGIGLTAFLNGIYEDRAGSGQVVGGAGRMVEAFFRAITRHHRQADPVVALAVSDEAGTYRPETEWVAARLREAGHRVFVVNPNELAVNENGVFLPNGTGGGARVDVVYRFFELFDHEAIPTFRPLLKAVEDGLVVMTPPAKPHLEEKLSLALFHHPDLADYWEEALPQKHRELLAGVIPRSWVVQAGTLPPGAAWEGPTLRGRRPGSWAELGSAAKADRELILKVSGFDPTAWGARGVVYGGDVPGEEWRKAVEQALVASATKVFIVQDFRKPALLKHPVYGEDAERAEEQPGRLRLCPYYFPKGGRANLSGGLATFCPADKKIIHGMEDAALVPVAHPAETDGE